MIIETTTALLFWMIIAHLLGDFPLQGECLASNKGSNAYMLAAHCAIWTGLVTIPLALAGRATPATVAFLFAGHQAMDYAKCWFGRKRPSRALTAHLWVDQAYHSVQLLFVVFFL